MVARCRSPMFLCLRAESESPLPRPRGQPLETPSAQQPPPVRQLRRARYGCVVSWLSPPQTSTCRIGLYPPKRVGGFQEKLCDEGRVSLFSDADRVNELASRREARYSSAGVYRSSNFAAVIAYSSEP